MPAEDEKLKYSYAIDPTAENNTAAAIYRIVDVCGPRILDLGSGPAIVSSQFARRPGHRVVCVDMDADALSAASKAGVHEVHTADLDSTEWHSDLLPEQFDCIILADVLEHLRRPQDLLASIVADGFLAPGGQLVISVPNASHESVIGSLLAGDFAYTETGILDQTHVRWFTLDSLSRLLEEHGFRIEVIHRTTRTLEQTQQSPYALSLSPTARLAIAEMGMEAKTLQYVVQATYRGGAVEGSPSQAIIDQIRKEFDEASKTAVADAQARMASAEEGLAQMVESLRDRDSEQESFRALAKQEVAAREAELNSLRSLIEQERAATARDVERLSNELASQRVASRRLRRQINDLISSRSWKVARYLSATTHPLASLHKLRRRLSAKFKAL